MFGRLVSGALKAAALPGRTIKYEVQVYADERWIIDCVVDDEEQAVACARALLGDEKNRRAKVVRQRSMATGFTTETVVFEEEGRAPGRREPGLSATITAAPACSTMDDLFTLDARVLINRVFREFLDKLVVTPTELLHNWSYIAKLDAAASLVSGAVYQVAQAQANAGQGPVKERVNQLWKLVDQVKARARDVQAERKRVPLLDPGGFAMFCRRAEARFEPAERAYMINWGLANYLTGSRNFGQKFEQIAALCTDDLDAGAVAHLDALVADTFGSGAMIQDLLGAQANLCAALAALADISTGRMTEAPKGASSSLKTLLSLVHRHGMPQAKAVLFDRLKRELKSAKPLQREGLSAERTALDMLESKLRDGAGAVIGGAEVEQALAERAERIRRDHLRQAGVAI